MLTDLFYVRRKGITKWLHKVCNEEINVSGGGKAWEHHIKCCELHVEDFQDT
jgi:hypothetical protein